jgi:hypothetical protein
MSELGSKKSGKKRKGNKSESAEEFGSGDKSEKNASKKNRSGKSGKSGKVAKVKPVVAEPVPWIYYYFCCFCVLPKKFRKNKRKMEQERREEEERVAREAAAAAAAEVPEPPGKFEPSIQHRAAVKIQALIRGYQAKQAMDEYWQLAVAEASDYWMQVIREREMAWLEKERKIVARKQVNFVLCSTQCAYYAYCEIMALPQFVLQYVDDIFQTSLAFLSQTSQASTEIQR